MHFVLLDAFLPVVITDLVLSYLSLCDFDSRFSSFRIYYPRRDQFDLPTPKPPFVQSVWDTRYHYPLMSDEMGIRLYGASILSLPESDIMVDIFKSEFALPNHCRCNEGFCHGLTQRPLLREHRNFITSHWLSTWLPSLDSLLESHTELHLRRSGILAVCFNMLALALSLCDKSDQEVTTAWLRDRCQSPEFVGWRDFFTEQPPPLSS